MVLFCNCALQRKRIFRRLLSHWKIDAREGEMARLCLTRPAGTTLFNIYRGLKLKLRNQPYQVKILELTAEQLRELKTPAIIGGAHAVVVKFDGDHAIIHDPLVRIPVQLNWREFRRYRYFTGDAVVLFATGK